MHAFQFPEFHILNRFKGNSPKKEGTAVRYPLSAWDGNTS